MTDRPALRAAAAALELAAQFSVSELNSAARAFPGDHPLAAALRALAEVGVQPDEPFSSSSARPAAHSGGTEEEATVPALAPGDTGRSPQAVGMKDQLIAALTENRTAYPNVDSIAEVRRMWAGEASPKRRKVGRKEMAVKVVNDLLRATADPNTIDSIARYILDPSSSPAARAGSLRRHG